MTQAATDLDHATTPEEQRAIKIGFLVNDVKTEEAGYTTIRLAKEAVASGHQAWLIGVGDLQYDPDDTISARARTVPKKRYTTGESFLADLHGKKAVVEQLALEELDVLMLRNDPSSDANSRPWATSVGIEFSRLAMRHGVVIVNDPNGLAKAGSKMYFQLFPEEVRPRTLISRDRDAIKDFVQAESGMAVLKPLRGSGGASVFLVRPDDVPNLNQMIDAVSRDGYVIVQEYLPAAAEGDMRLFVMNGRPLRVKGKYAAFRRVRTGGDMRSNIHAGGKIQKADVDANALRIAEIVRPKLVQDGMFLVGLDIVGDKLMEINVFSPGGLGSTQKFEKINFSKYVLEALYRKVHYMSFYGRNFDKKFEKINFSKYVLEALYRKVHYMSFYGRNFDNVDMCTL